MTPLEKAREEIADRKYCRSVVDAIAIIDRLIAKERAEPAKPEPDFGLTRINPEYEKLLAAKPEPGDVVWLSYSDGSGGPREWTRWYDDHDPLKGDTHAESVVLLMRAAEVKRRIEEAGK